MKFNRQKLLRENPDIKDFLALRPTLWLNPATQPDWQGPYTIADVQAADADLHRYAPLIETVFPETVKSHGIIESPLVAAPKMGQALAGTSHFTGHLLVKLDSELPVAGSIKAQGWDV